MPEPDKTQTKTPAGGEQSKQIMPGLFVPPEPQAVEQNTTTAVDPIEEADKQLKIAPTEDGEVDTTPEPVEFKRFKDDDEEAAVTAGVSFSEMKNRQKNESANQAPVTKLADKSADKTKQLPPERDYSGIDEADIPLFKKMSNESFSAMRTLYSERKQLKQELEANKNKQPETVHPSLYNHPQGYLLDTKFNELATVANLAEQAEDHWQRQLIKIQNGKDWTDLSYDSNTGRLIESEPKVADESAQIYVSKNLRKTQATSLDVSRQRDDYIKNYNNRFKENSQFVSGIINQYFPGHDKPDHVTANAQKQILNLLPESMRDLPTTPLLCIIAAHNILLQNQLAKLQGNKTVAAAVMNDAKNAPPPASAFKSGGGNNGQVSFAAMRNRG